MRLFVSAVLLLFIVPQAYAKAIFVYNAHGKRDPLTPLVSTSGTVLSYDSDMTISDLTLEGIVVDPRGDNAAIIDGKVVKAKDNIGPYTIASIAIDHVELLKDNQKFTLKLKKGGA